MGSYSTLKLVSTPHYHLWTDALHARELARTANNDWDRGTYVRWAVISAWTAFEITCEHYLGANGLGNRFKENLNEAIDKKKLSPIEWGSGIWQKVYAIYQSRNNFVHVSSSQADLFPGIELADRAINDLRNGIKAVFDLVNVSHELWVNDDEDRGWDADSKTSCHAYIVRSGASIDDPNSIRLAYLYKGHEYAAEVCPSNTDLSDGLNSLIASLRIPVTSVRAYKGNKLIEDRILDVRGN